VIFLKRRFLFFLAHFFLLLFTFFHIVWINQVTKDKVLEYSTMLASKITKYVVNNAYAADSFDLNRNHLYEIVKGNDGEIKTILYDTKAVNDLLSAINDKVYTMFDELENGNLKKINIQENILTNSSSSYDNGIVLEIPSGIVMDNYLFANLGPRIPVRISLTGGLESHLSTKVEEYGINNALVSLVVNIRVTEQITMPFITKEIVIENEIPVTIHLINGKIPDYYLNGFSRSSNVYKSLSRFVKI